MWRGWCSILDMTITGWSVAVGWGWLWGGTRGALMATGSPASWLPWCLHNPTRGWTVMSDALHTQYLPVRAPDPDTMLQLCKTPPGEQGEGPETLSTIFATPCYPAPCFQNMKCFTFSRVDLESDPYSLWTLWFEIVYLQTALNEEHSFARIDWSNMYDCLTSQLSQKYNFQRDQKYR